MPVLEDVTVIDLSRILAAPFAAQMLGDLGATVWKIESLGGDDARMWGDHYFAAGNRNKRSLAINLKDPRGQRIARELAARADVMIENYKVGDLARYGLDYPTLAAADPKLIYMSMTGFGQTGPRRAQLGYDTVLQALTGIMTLTGDPDRPPGKVGVAWIDVMSGLTATIGILAALRERDRSGHGQHIDLSLYDVGMMALVDAAQDWLQHGKLQMRQGSVHRSFAPSQPFECSDGWVTLAIGNNEQFERLCRAMGHPEWAADPRFASNKLRLEHREALAGLMGAVFRGRSRNEWIAAFEAQQAPLSQILNVAEALADPQSAARRTVWRVPNGNGALPLLANPLQHMSRSPAAPSIPPPKLGEHTAEVLQHVLGLDAEEIAGLSRDGVIGVPS